MLCSLTHSPQILLKDLASLMTYRLGDQWSKQDVSKALQSAGFVSKVVFNLAAEARPDLQAKYRHMCEMRGYAALNYVCIDEVGVVSVCS